MNRKKQKEVGVAKKSPLPTHIELIDEKTARIKEFTFEHATRLLRLQKQSGLGSYTIYNVQLYFYDEKSSSILPVPQQFESSEGNSILIDTN